MKEQVVFKKNLKAFLSPDNRIIANRGGTRSGKTFGIMKLLCTIALTSKFHIDIDICAENLPRLKMGPLVDVKKILDMMNAHDGVNFHLNKTDHIYEFDNCTMRFLALDEWEKAKGPGRDILFVNECNRVPWETVRQLFARTTNKIFLDWNPDSEFWFEKEGLEKRDNTHVIHSTYLDNPVLSKEQIEEIESYRDDENWWRVYGLGLTGKHQGIIYTNWDTVKAVPRTARFLGYGMDFGYNDPTAIVALYQDTINKKDLYVDEICYKKKMLTDDILKVYRDIRQMGAPIVADCQNGNIISELKDKGLVNIEPCNKGNDSIVHGINVLCSFKVHVTQRSINVLYEQNNYRWAEDRITGELLNKPDPRGHFDHALDALRYIATKKLIMPRIKHRPRARVRKI